MYPTRQIILTFLYVHMWVVLITVLFAMPVAVYASDIPSIYSNIIEKNGKLYVVNKKDGEEYSLKESKTKYTLKQLIGNPKGTEEGISFNFGDINGTLYYGFIKFGDGRYPQPVFYKKSTEIKDGKAVIKISKMKGKYDMVGWKKAGKGTLGYRVVGSKGSIIYDGKVSFIGKGPFKVNVSFIEGPFINLLTHNSGVLSFDTNSDASATVEINNKTFTSEKTSTHHEIELTGLSPSTVYDYKVTVKSGDLENSEAYQFKTAPEPGTRKPFVFAYASDSRKGQGGGERDIYGVNAYILKKVLAVASSKEAAFFQFTGDLINGYLSSVEGTRVQYRNAKRALEPFTHYMPIYVGFGNHEAITHVFDNKSKKGIRIAQFPFDTQSGEAIFAEQFVFPTNGPVSEDGSKYDPDLNKRDFPTYQENVYYYIHDNVAVVVLNSNYWYVPAIKDWFRYGEEKSIPKNGYIATGGNLHGYLMDNQLDWLDKTINTLDQNADIDFIFVTVHTPVFPNGGHKSDDMWYYGNNRARAYVSEKAVDTGIIEQRDKCLKILDKSSKPVILLTGDEHNYNRTMITSEVNIYPEGYDKERITITKPLWQINNGAAGSPYYAQESLPWSEHAKAFTTQNAVVLFHVEGKNLKMTVINPDTLDKIDEIELYH